MNKTVNKIYLDGKHRTLHTALEDNFTDVQPELLDLAPTLKGPAFGLRLCYCCLEIIPNF